MCLKVRERVFKGKVREDEILWPKRTEDARLWGPSSFIADFSAAEEVLFGGCITRIFI